MEGYAKRLQHYTRFTLLELPPGHSKEEEAELILSKLGPNEALVAMDERGEQPTSVELSRLLATAQTQARDLAFVIGGDEGLAPVIREKAWKVLALSKLTLPHRLARVVLVEQLYRGFSLLRGEPYHK